METIAEAVLYFRLKPLRKEEGVEQQCLVITNFNKDTKLALACRPYIMNVLQYEGATAVHGSAPRGPLEREIAKMVNNANSQRLAELEARGSISAETAARARSGAVLVSSYADDALPAHPLVFLPGYGRGAPGRRGGRGRRGGGRGSRA
eukprot:273322-Pyramimonas_sp.AAC.1